MLLAGGLPFAGAFAASGLVTEVFTIGYRPVDEMIQILRPMVPSPGSVSGAYGKIVVRTTPANMREIKGILATLNRAPSNLLISVRHSMNEDVRRDLFEAFGEVSGGNVGLSTGRGSGSGRGLVISHQDGDREAGVRMDKTQAVASVDGTQRVRVLEGKEAFIQSGQSAPLTNERVVVSSTGVTTVQTSTEFRNVGSGFSVRARLNGNDRVTVEIFHRHNRLASGSAAIDVREASTVVSSPLGRWMEIGRVGTASSESTRAIGASSSTAASSDTVTYLKVERLDR
jgi:type II secretory pathway component GspD/PulD (secretin)